MINVISGFSSVNFSEASMALSRRFERIIEMSYSYFSGMSAVRVHTTEIPFCSAIENL